MAEAKQDENHYVNTIVEFNIRIASKIGDLFNVTEDDDITKISSVIDTIIVNRSAIVKNRPEVSIDDDLQGYMNDTRVIEFLFYENGDELETLSQRTTLYESNFRLICIVQRSIYWYCLDISLYMKYDSNYEKVKNKMAIVLYVYKTLRDTIHICERCKVPRLHESMMFIGELTKGLQTLIVQIGATSNLYEPEQYSRVMSILIDVHNSINRMDCYI